MDPAAQPDPQRPTGVYPQPDGSRIVIVGPEHVGARVETVAAALAASAPDLRVVVEGGGIRISHPEIGTAGLPGPALPSTRKMKGGKARRPGRRLANATPAPRPVRR